MKLTFFFLDVLRLVWHFFEQNNSRVRSFYLPRTHTRSSDGIFLHTRDFSLSKVTALKVAGADPGFFLGGGALVSCPTSTPINHIVFFFGRIPVVLENRRSSQGGGGGVVRTPLHLPPRSAPVIFLCITSINLFQKTSSRHYYNTRGSASGNFYVNSSDLEL